MIKSNVSKNDRRAQLTSFYILMQIKLIFTWNVLDSGSFWKLAVLEK